MDNYLSGATDNSCLFSLTIHLTYGVTLHVQTKLPGSEVG